MADRILGMGTVTRDISEARRVTDELRLSEERFRLMIDEAPIGMALVSLDGRFSRVNRVLCDIVGYTRGIVGGAEGDAVDGSRLGDCPRCGRSVIEGTRGFGCSGWKDGCPFVLWKEYKGGRLEVGAFQAVHCRPGEWVRYGSPGPEGAEYIAVCLPAFSPDAAHRD